ncbi:MAG TPA: DUF4383 domain-containing protein [Candidatus Saccharimonadales bacterium]|jgi:hypothetical protein
MAYNEAIKLSLNNKFKEEIAMLRKAALATGIVFLLIGLLGFVDAFTPDGKLLGLFLVDGTHNFVHLLSGLAAVIASQRADWSRLFFKVMGVVYGLVTVLGFLAGDGGQVLGLFHVNTADNFLHLILSAAFLYLGFGKGADRAHA